MTCSSGFLFRAALGMVASAEGPCYSMAGTADDFLVSCLVTIGQ